MKSCVPPPTRSLVPILPTEARVKLKAAESSVKDVVWPEPRRTPARLRCYQVEEAGPYQLWELGGCERHTLAWPRMRW
jgi:hypothetical protein